MNPQKQWASSILPLVSCWLKESWQSRPFGTRQAFRNLGPKSNLLVALGWQFLGPLLSWYHTWTPRAKQCQGLSEGLLVLLETNTLLV